jgi:hypothetical protein
MRRELVALGGELAHHHLGVDEILRAAETDKTNFQSGKFLSPQRAGRLL